MKILVDLQPETQLDVGVADPSGKLQQALNLHIRGKYTEAINRLSAIASASSGDAMRANAERLIGLSYLLKKRPEKALAHLQRARVHAGPVPESKALWYISNAHLLLGNREMAVKYLEQTILAHQAERDKAQQLLSKLRKIPGD